jgi:TolB-like protein
VGAWLLAGTLIVAAAGGETPCTPLAYAVSGPSALDVTSRCDDGHLSIGDTVTLAPGQVLELRGEGGRRRCAVLGKRPRSYRLDVLVSPLQPAADNRERCSDDAGLWRCRRKRADQQVASGSVCSAVVAAPATTAPGGPGGAAPTAPAIAADDEGPLRVFVMNLKAVGINPGAADLVTDLVTGELGGYRRIDVLSGQDVQQLLRLEADRQAMACDEGASCMAELAEALGARFLLRGQVSRVEGVLVVNLSLVDTSKTSVIAREEARARDLEDLQRRIAPLVNNVLQGVLTLAPRPLPEVELGRKMADGDTLLAASAVGGLTFIGALGVLLVPGLVVSVLSTVYNAARPSDFGPLQPLFLQLPVLYVVLLVSLVASPMCGPLLSVCGASAAAGVGSTWVDEWFGQQSNGWRAAATSVGALVAGMVGLLITVGLTVTAGLLVGVVGSMAFAFALPWIALAAGVVALVPGAVAAAAAYDVSVGVFGDVPLTSLPVDEVALAPSVRGHGAPSHLAAAQRF